MKRKKPKTISTEEKELKTCNQPISSVCNIKVNNISQKHLQVDS